MRESEREVIIRAHRLSGLEILIVGARSAERGVMVFVVAYQMRLLNRERVERKMNKRGVESSINSRIAGIVVEAYRAVGVGTLDSRYWE